MGNGEVGINLWAQKNGTLNFYISRTDSLAESGRLLKVGQVCVKLDPNPFAEGQPFRQRLDLRDGLCEITAGKGDREVTLTVFVDADYPVVHVIGKAASPLTVTVTTPSWRERWQDIRKSIEAISAYTMREAPFPVIESADVFPAKLDGAIAWYHRNESDVAFTSTLELQKLRESEDKAVNLIKHRTFGGWITGEGFRPVNARTYETTHPTRTFSLCVAAPAAQTETAEQWLDLARTTAAKAADPKQALERTRRWWNQFWDRSWIIIDDRPNQKSDKASDYTRGYMLQRYMNACGGRGNLPIKFNGSIFTVEPAKQWHQPYSPDYRMWGDPHWWQNIRFPYHTMLASGDFEMMQPMFRMYESARPICEARVKRYWDQQGVWFPETMTPWGTYSNWDYGWERDNRPIDQLRVSLGLMWNAAPELVCLMLDYYDYTGDRKFLTERVVPMAEAVLKFFDTHFKKNEAGQIIINPTHAVETFQNKVTNDAPTVAGLIAMTRRLTALPKDTLTPEQRAYFQKMKAACPPIPVEEITLDGRKVKALAPAESYDPGRSNEENPEVYPIWPFRLYGIGRPDYDLALAAYKHREKKYLHAGWGYDGDIATNLGLTDDAKEDFNIQVHNSRGGYRWPATWGPNFDWHPDQCHGGNLMLTAQYMLLQAVGEKLYLMPAWPKEWNVDFKLHAPGNTTVECVYRGGKIERLDVTPASRRKDIVLPEFLTSPKQGAGK